MVSNKIKLFTTSLLQVCFVAMNVVFIGKQMFLEMFITGGLISLIWTINVKKIVFSEWMDRIIYSLGAACGTLLGWCVSQIIIYYLK